MKKNNILIVGTGALATLFAAKLSAVGINVTMLGSWNEGITALNKKGAHIAPLCPSDTSPLRGENLRGQVRAVRECKNARYAIVLVKSWQTEQVARQLAKCLSPDGIALTLQNGLGNGEMLANILGAERVAQGVTVVGASLLEPGVVKISGDARISVGAHPRLRPVEALLRASKFQVTHVADVQSLIWSKLVINSAINPLSALLDIPNGDLLKHPSAKALMGELAHEAASLAAAQNIPLSFDDPATAAEDVARRTSSNISSMLQDLRRGAPTEIDAICGAITRSGEKFGVPTPLNKICWQLVKAKAESANRGKIRKT